MADSSSTSAGVPKTEKIWLDGQFVPWDQAQIHVMTLGLHYGIGAFEGIRAYACTDGRSAVFRLKDHVRRLYQSARIMLMEVPYPLEMLTRVCLETLQVNKMKQGYVRPLVFMGDGAMGLGAINPVRVAVMAWDWGSYLGEEGMKKGIRAKVSSFTRMHVNSNLVRGKITGQYVNSVLAKREAKLAGYDEAIFLDAQGLVAEATGENLFLVREGVVHTPPLTSPILEGITRSSLIRLLRDAGLEVREQSFTRDTLYLADEVFLCGTAAEVTPVREVDNRKVVSGEFGPFDRLAQECFFKAARG
ncbi:MAG: branched-chain amino acid transaminase, partial [Deltaproteobacteria bacterium]|nr:branched-chain amino acid transaminase [Deltaproteobacteria bacterium]